MEADNHHNMAPDMSQDDDDNNTEDSDEEAQGGAMDDDDDQEGRSKGHDLLLLPIGGRPKNSRAREENIKNWQKD